MTSWIIDTTTQVRDFFVPARNGWMLYLAAAMLVMLYIFLILPGHLERLVAFIYSKITGKQAVKQPKKKPKKAQKPSKPKRQKKTVRYKTKIVYRDRIQYKDKIVYRDKEPKIVYKDKIIYKDAPKQPAQIVYVDKPVKEIVYVNVPVDHPVEKIVYKEKIVEKPIEKIVYVDRPVEKIVYRDNPTPIPATKEVSIPITQPEPQRKSNINVLLKRKCSSKEVYYNNLDKTKLIKDFLTKPNNVETITRSWRVNGPADIDVEVSYTSEKGKINLASTIKIPYEEFKSYIKSDSFEKLQRNRTATYRKEVLARDKNTCQICGYVAPPDHLANLHIDHIIPIDKGGLTQLSNLQVLCADCNLKKGNKIY